MPKILNAHLWVVLALLASVISISNCDDDDGISVIKRAGGRNFLEKKGGGRSFTGSSFDKKGGGRPFAPEGKRGGGRGFASDGDKRGGGRSFISSPSDYLRKRGGGRMFASDLFSVKRLGGRGFNSDAMWKRGGGRGFSPSEMKRGGGRGFSPDEMKRDGGMKRGGGRAFTSFVKRPGLSGGNIEDSFAVGKRPGARPFWGFAPLVRRDSPYFWGSHDTSDMYRRKRPGGRYFFYTPEMWNH